MIAAVAAGRGKFCPQARPQRVERMQTHMLFCHIESRELLEVEKF